MTRARAAADELVYEQIEERRRSGERGDDILSMLLDARHEDGSEMSREEIRDELMTALVAGHETTASELAFAWTFLAHEPRVLAELQAELAAGRRRRLPHRRDPGDAAAPAPCCPRPSRGW